MVFVTTVAILLGTCHVLWTSWTFTSPLVQGSKSQVTLDRHADQVPHNDALADVLGHLQNARLEPGQFRNTVLNSLDLRWPI